MKTGVAIALMILLNGASPSTSSFFASERSYYSGRGSDPAQPLLKISQKCADIFNLERYLDAVNRIVIQRVNLESRLSNMIVLDPVGRSFMSVDCAHKHVAHGKIGVPEMNLINSATISEPGFYSFASNILDGEYYLVTDKRGGVNKRIAAYEPLSAIPNARDSVALGEARKWAHIFERVLSSAP